MSSESFTAAPLDIMSLPIEVLEIMNGAPAPKFIEVDIKQAPTHYHGDYHQPNQQQRTTNFLERLGRDEKIYHLYIEGWTVTDIMEEMSVDRNVVTRSLQKRREDIYLLSTKNTADEIEDRIAAIMIIKRQVEQFLREDPNKAPAYLKLKLDAEKQIASLRGLDVKTLNAKFHVTHEVKTYDFVDTLPPALGTTVDSTGKVIN